MLPFYVTVMDTIATNGYLSFGNSSGSLVLTVMIDSTLIPALMATPPVSDARW